MDIITGESVSSHQPESTYTGTAKLSTANIDFGSIIYGETKKATVTFQNIGKNPLIIQEVKTSCGCMLAEYDKKPIQAGHTANVTIIYHATNIGVINKSIKILSNTKESPYNIKVKGVVENKK